MTVVQQVGKASGQLAGSISKVRSGLLITVHCDDREVRIDLSGKVLRGLVVVKETFDTDVLRYAKVLTVLASQTGVPCVLMDYSQLHAVTANRATPDGFLEVFRWRQIAASSHEYVTAWSLERFDRILLAKGGSAVDKAATVATLRP